ncbi:MAG: 50S ribosomal protein L1 [Nitrosopumilus sp.]|nr:50S ribosomal protein L1 [Nitrosopumilus sp.]MDA7999199.1 50S ribosomal protein L1 [Nitrosopumilus sp.]
MITEEQLAGMIAEAKKTGSKKFKQSVELMVSFKDIDVKKGFSMNELVQLPKTSSPAAVCVIATGDMAQKAKQADADAVVGDEEIGGFASNKRESLKFINKYDFFLADTKMMSTIATKLGPILGPRNKMPAPVPFNTPIGPILQRFRSSVRIKGKKNSLGATCKIGDESMDDADLAVNAHAVLGAVEKKLPNGEKNIRGIAVKTTMGRPAREARDAK